MKDYREEAERVWQEYTGTITKIFAPNVHDQEGTILPIVATALQAAYRAGVEAVEKAPEWYLDTERGWLLSEEGMERAKARLLDGR